MRDPYQVLGVSNTATDDEIKKAYRKLARKFHPDNYHDNPLEDLAQERMKEINEAYELIQNQRKNPYNASTSYGDYDHHSAYHTASDSADGAIYRRIRVVIAQGNLNLADELLNAEKDHNAEWCFLKGSVCFRRGWLDEAKRYYEAAVQMNPTNAEYKYGLEALYGQQGTYRPDGYRVMTTTGCEGDAISRICGAIMCINCLSGGGLFFCC